MLNKTIKLPESRSQLLSNLSEKPWKCVICSRGLANLKRTEGTANLQVEMIGEDIGLERSRLVGSDAW